MGLNLERLYIIRYVNVDDKLESNDYLLEPISNKI